MTFSDNWRAMLQLECCTLTHWQTESCYWIS